MPFLVAALILVVAPAASAAPPAPEAADAERPRDEADDGWDDEEDAGPNGVATVFLLETFSASLHWTAGAVLSIVGSKFAHRGVDASDERLRFSEAGAHLAGPFLAGWGAHWVGEENGRAGSYWAAVGGAAAGELLGFGAVRLIDGPSRLQRFVFPAVLAGAGAAAGSLLWATDPAEAPPALSVGAGGGGLRLAVSGSF